MTFLIAYKNIIFLNRQNYFEILKKIINLNQELKLYREEERLNPNTENSDFLETSHAKFFDMDPAQIKLELSLLQKKFDILNERDIALKTLCSYQAKQPKNSKDLAIFINDVLKLLNGKKSK